jgi:hypothetical protein
MAKKKDLYTLVSSSSGDWEGLYKNGSLMLQGHNITVEDVFELLDLDYETVEAAEDWVEGQGELPKKLQDVQL